MPLDFNEIRQLLATIAQTDIAEVILKSDDFEITVRKAVSFSGQISSVSQSVSSALPGNLPTVSPTPNPLPSVHIIDGTTNRTVDNVVQNPQSSPSPSPIEQKLLEIPSPMVGTFYRAPAPGEPAFIEVGDRIRSGQTVCIIEAMKLMNEIEAEVSGQVIEILLQNGEPVEYGQPLMRINPD
ncbi:MAG: acetyl-CoA carboxylase biotin carboxyl carrier protein [Scytonematopsis contorta HA4267-MV1]|nr:acetyl-CoA carboxylase biotin carboxyl carrier protein [Scytonematopsis contorta HA4267-MV1]